jgi:hypothetical protein
VTIIDSLFLELGVDTSKFSKDQQAALKKIAEFESQTKRAAGNARGGIKTVGDAFRDLAKDSRIGSSAAGIENLATKFKNLGMSMQVSGGAGAPLGMMAKGLGMLLSPAALGAAAIGLIGKEVWDLNRDMTASNATLARNAELSGMSATNLWAMGQAVKTVGGNAEGVEASIAGLQTAFAGMSIGVGSAVPQMIGMARLRKYGAKFNPGGFGQGADEESLFKAAQAMYQRDGRAKTMALLTGYGLMNTDQANLAMSKGGWDEYKKAQAQANAMKTGGGFGAVVRNSLKSQVGLGENDIAGSVAAMTAYGGIQQPMQSIVGLLTDIRAFVSSILNWISNPGKALAAAKDAAKSAWDATVDAASHAPDNAVKVGQLLKGLVSPSARRMRGAESSAMQFFMDRGIGRQDAAAIVGSLAQESSMDPFAKNNGHVGYAQWDKTRAAVFAKRFGYQMGSSSVSKDQQGKDQLQFILDEFQTTQKNTVVAMAKARDLMGKTSAFMNLYERPGDNSLGKRFENAQMAERLADVAGMISAVNSATRSAVHNDNRSDTQIGDIHVHTNATDPASHAAAVRRGIADQPLLNHAAQGTVALSTRALQ